LTAVQRCPQSITAVGAEGPVVRAMLSTTNTGSSVFTGESMLNKFKEIKKAMLSHIANWNVCCDSPAHAAVIGGMRHILQAHFKF
jgi:hypothetical protein